MHRTSKIPAVLILVLLMLCTFESDAQSDKAIVYKIDIKEMIAPPIWHKVKKGLEEAEQLKVDYILIHMNTYGGMVDMADSIRTKILSVSMPVLVFIDNNAASAGALISIACDSIYMKNSAAIGAATVVNQTGEAMPDKYQSYMRATMRATAEATGRDPLIAEGMVDPSVEVPGISDSDKVITFTAKEAMKHGFCNDISENINEILKKKIGLDGYEIKELEITFVDKIIAFLIHPMVSSILLLMIFGGIYFELQTPGVGFPIAAALLGAILYFAPHYLQGLADNWEILLFVVGVLLLAAEIFVIPGFGVAGVLGIIAIVGGLTLSGIQNDMFDFSYTPNDDIFWAFVRVILPMVLLTTALLFFGSKLMEMKMFRRLILEDVQSHEEGYVLADQELSLIGKIGVARSVLRPSGKVLIEGKVYDAKVNFGWIEEGTAVKVIGQERYEITVSEV